MISRRRKIALAALITATVLLAVFLCRSDPSEKQLQAAYDDACARSDPFSTDHWTTEQIALMRSAVTNLGTNALPVLVSWIECRSKPSLIQNNTVRKLGQKLHINSVAFWRMAYSDHLRANLAVRVIGVFRGHVDTGIAVPRLKELAKKDPSFAEAALTNLGEPP